MTMQQGGEAQPQREPFLNHVPVNRMAAATKYFSEAVDGIYVGGTYPDLNDQMTQEHRDALTAYIRGENIDFSVDGVPFIIDQATSVQSVEESFDRQQERNTNLGS